MKTRIIYLTKDCNFNCSYCFERNQHKKESASYEQLDKMISEIIKEEPNEVSTICFFGGEPLLEFDKMKYVFKKCINEKLKSGKQFAFNTITNGSLIEFHVDDIKEMINNPDSYFSLHISYDGSFQDRRSKSKSVEKNLNLLVEKKIPFGISYTIINENSDFKIVISDLVKLIKKYFLHEFNCQSIIRLNFDRRDLEVGGKDYNKYMETLKQYLNYLYEKYKIPFCSLTCDICKRCKKENCEGMSYVIPGKKDFEQLGINGIKKEFNHF